MTDNHLPPLIQALQNPKLFGHPAGHFRVIQTHISWVLLTGRFAYKIKKPLNLGFLDFSSLKKRLFYCQEELRLNKRLSEKIYLDVIPISGSPEAPILNGKEPPIEYAVKMREFPQDAQLDRVLARGQLLAGHIDGLTTKLAQFHQRIPVAPMGSPFGSPNRIIQPIRENFQTIFKNITSRTERQDLSHLEHWIKKTHQLLRPLMKKRKKQGFIRECHGDMHLGNMALLKNQVIIFDCLEFNENLRWIDVMSEIAFLTMDLEDRRQYFFANKILNGYLEKTGDYEGTRILRYFQVYRALVRAKVSCIRLNQEGITKKDQKLIREEIKTYLNLAKGYTHPKEKWLAITHGFSGSGKTTLTQFLLEKTGALRIRTDVERKRLKGLSPSARTRSPIGKNLYSSHVTRQVYLKMRGLAKMILGAGFPVIVDGTFLKKLQRKILQPIARDINIPFVILNFKAPESTLRSRINRRKKKASDASEANLDVLKHQIFSQEPLEKKEQFYTIDFDVGKEIKEEQKLKKLIRLIKKLKNKKTFC
ncbi:MAG TPA: AAA family ATPase [Nitrospiria bacterium]